MQWRGELTLRGVSSPFMLRERRFTCRDEAPAPQRCGGGFEGTLRRADFGLSLGLPFVADEVRVVVHVLAEPLP